MKKCIKWMGLFTIIISLLVSSLSPIFAQENMDSIISDETIDETSELVESVPVQEESQAIIEEPAINETSENSAEPNEEVESAGETEATLNLTINNESQIDDNTVFFEGTTAGNKVVQLLGANNQLVAEQVSKEDGSFSFQIDQPFEANSVITFRVLSEEATSERQVNVLGYGLQVTSEVAETDTHIEGTTSPNRQLRLLDEASNILAETVSDSKGNFDFALNKPLNPGQAYQIQVLDQGQVARTLQIDINEKQQKKAIPQVATMAINQATTFQNSDEYLSVSIENVGDSLRISGTVNEEESQNGLVDALGEVVEIVIDLLYDLSAEYFYINLVDNTGRFLAKEVQVDNGTFEFEVPNDLAPGTELIAELHAHYETNGLLAILIGGGGDELITSLPLEVPGRMFSSPPGNIHMSEVIRYEPNAIISSPQGLNIEVFDNTGSDWQLTAQSSGTLTDSSGNMTLPGTVLFNDGASLLPLQDSVVVASKADATTTSTNTYSLSWPAGEGLVIQTNPVEAQPNVEYSTSINWDLTNGPQ